MALDSFKPLELSAGMTVFANKHNNELAIPERGNVGWLEIPVADREKWGASLSYKETLKLVETKSKTVRIELLYSTEVSPSGWVLVETHRRAREAAKAVRRQRWAGIGARFTKARQRLAEYRGAFYSDGPGHAYAFVH